MVPQFIPEVHGPYRRKIREPDDPPGGPDGRILRALRRSPRKGSGIQGERGPADHPGHAGILPCFQPDISGRVYSVLGIEATQNRTAISTALLPSPGGPRSRCLWRFPIEPGLKQRAAEFSVKAEVRFG